MVKKEFTYNRITYALSKLNDELITIKVLTEPQRYMFFKPSKKIIRELNENEKKYQKIYALEELSCMLYNKTYFEDVYFEIDEELIPLDRFISQEQKHLILKRKNTAQDIQNIIYQDYYSKKVLITSQLLIV